MGINQIMPLASLVQREEVENQGFSTGGIVCLKLRKHLRLHNFFAELPLRALQSSAPLTSGAIGAYFSEAAKCTECKSKQTYINKHTRRTLHIF